MKKHIPLSQLPSKTKKKQSNNHKPAGAWATMKRKKKKLQYAKTASNKKARL